jgi:hypothetical protein
MDMGSEELLDRVTPTFGIYHWEVELQAKDGTLRKEKMVLSKKVVPNRCSLRGMGSKLEFTLKKATVSDKWEVLEEGTVAPPTPAPGKKADSDSDPKKPEGDKSGTCCKKETGDEAKAATAPKSVPKQAEAKKKAVPGEKKNWDKIVKEFEVEEEKEEKDVNHLFQKIFSQGDEETQRAMNKSYVESGGTVLSTNWKEVGSKKIKPHGEKSDESDQDTTSDEDNS